MLELRYNNFWRKYCDGHPQTLIIAWTIFLSFNSIYLSVNGNRDKYQQRFEKLLQTITKQIQDELPF